MSGETSEDARVLMVRRHKRVPDVGLVTPTTVIEMTSDDLDAVNAALRQSLPGAGADRVVLERILVALESANIDEEDKKPRA